MTGADIVEVFVADPPGSASVVNQAAVRSPVPAGELSFEARARRARDRD